jgi:hypothetical protein
VTSYLLGAILFMFIGGAAAALIQWVVGAIVVTHVARHARKQRM